MKTMKTMFLAFTAVSATFLLAMGICVAGTSDITKLNVGFLGWYAAIQACATIMSIAVMNIYFGNNLWKSQKELDDAKYTYLAKVKEINEWLEIIGKHEAIKMIKEKQADKK